MILIAILLQSLSEPLPPPPPRESLEVALTIWADHPPTAEERKYAVDLAVEKAIGAALREIGIPARMDPSAYEEYATQAARFRPLIERQLPVNWTQADWAAGQCVVDAMARSMTPSELGEARRFLATAAGSKFWRAARIMRDFYPACLERSLDLRASVGDYIELGFKPPKALLERYQQPAID